jgi:hypothetical protein
MLPGKVEAAPAAEGRGTRIGEPLCRGNGGTAFGYMIGGECKGLPKFPSQGMVQKGICPTAPGGSPGLHPNDKVEGVMGDFDDAEDEKARALSASSSSSCRSLPVDAEAPSEPLPYEGV